MSTGTELGQKLGQDLRSAWRSLRRSPGLVLAAMLTLGVGMGAGLTVYAWARSLLLRPFPGVTDGLGVGSLFLRAGDGDAISLSVPELHDAEDALAGVARVAGQDLRALGFTEGERAERVWASTVSGSYFEVLGIQPALGRFFRGAEDRAPGAAPGVVASHAFWLRRLGGDPDAVGRPLELNGRPFTLLGVAPRGFGGTYTGLMTDLFVPLSLRGALGLAPEEAFSSRESHSFEGVWRLAEGASFAEASARVSALGERWKREHPEIYRDRTPALVDRWNAPWGASRVMAPVMILLGAMSLAVLGIAAANVSGLLLARGLRRRRELALRMALGGRRFDLVRLCGAEASLLALGGGVVGWGVALATRGVLFRTFPPMNLPIEPNLDLGLDGILVGVALVVVAALLCAVSPALLVRDTAPLEGLRVNPASGVRRRGRFSLRQVLVVVQVALGATLLVSAVLTQRALQRGLEISPGFDTRGVLIAAVDLPSHGFDAAESRAFFDRALSALDALPGVRRAALARRLPLDISGVSSTEIEVPSAVGSAGEVRPEQRLTARTNAVSPGYFAAMGIPLTDGRDFRDGDDESSTAVAIVSRAMAERFWPGSDGSDAADAADAVGKTFRSGEQEITVIGVAAEVKNVDLGEASRPFFYRPVAQGRFGSVFVVVGTGGDPALLVPALRQTMRSIDPRVALFAVKTMPEHFGFAVYKQRVAGSALLALGVVALLLAVVGLYGLLAFFVALRSHDLGLRRALGATTRDVVREVAGEAIRPLRIGLVLGLGAAALGGWLGGGAYRALLFGASPFDPLAFGATAAVLALTAAAALFLPARRALRIDPARALREE